MNNQAQNEWPKTWPAWVIKIATELEAAEKEPEFLSSDDAPPWVHTLDRELLRVIHPALNLAEGKECGARFIGQTVGHQDALLNGEYGLAYQLNKMEAALETLDQQLRAKLNKKAYRRLCEEGQKYKPDVEKFVEGLEYTVAAKKNLIKAVLQTAAEQDPKEKAEFFAGYNEALSAPVYEEQGQLVHEKLTTKIYILMCLFWRMVRKFPSTAVLHQWLTRMLGSNIVGDLGRIRKICFRLKLKLAPKGRPRKMRR